MRVSELPGGAQRATRLTVAESFDQSNTTDTQGAPGELRFGNIPTVAVLMTANGPENKDKEITSCLDVASEAEREALYRTERQRSSAL